MDERFDLNPVVGGECGEGSPTIARHAIATTVAELRGDKQAHERAFDQRPADGIQLIARQAAGKFAHVRLKSIGPLTERLEIEPEISVISGS